MCSLNKEEYEKEWLRGIITANIGDFSRQLSSSDTVDKIKISDIQIKFIGVDEAFMLTTCYRARVTLETADSTETKSLVVKRTPNLPQELFDSINFATLFGNELVAYSTILPAYENLAGKIFNLAQFFHGEVGKCSAHIILEDFSTRGWSVAKELTNLSLSHIMLATKYLARLHACGFALRLTQPKEFDKLSDKLKDSRYATSIVHQDYALLLKESIPRMATSVQRHEPDVPIPFLDRLVDLISNIYKYGKWRVIPRDPMITLCHGDFLRNNIAFKYENEDYKHPLDVMMFDMQTMRATSPMMDLTLLLNISTFAEVRRTHFTDIFGAYCDELASSFSRFAPGVQLPEYLGPESLVCEYIRFLPYSCSITSSFLPALVEPNRMTSEEMLLLQRTPDEVIAEAWQRGGDIVDREVAHQVREMYDLAQKYGVDVIDGYPL